MNDSISLYIHIPFCVKKCAYCDFVSFPPAVCNDSIKDEYIGKLAKELEYYSCITGRKVETAYIGGGTPTSLSVEQLKRLLENVDRCFDIVGEFSIEANPATVDTEKIKILRDHGVNRISIGLQSIHDRELKVLGRAHDHADFLKTFEIVKKGGFDNINVDLMSALPGSDISSWSETLKTVADMDVKHISAYSLIIEDGTPFGEIYGENNAGRKKPGYPDLPDEETEREMYHITNDHLSSHGFFQYEISNYAKSGFECRHNKVYWQGGYYIGAGLSAAGHLPAECFDRSGVRSFRYKNTSDITEYLEFKPENIPETCKEFEPVTDTDAARELFIFGLRMNEGVDVKKAMGVAFDPEFAREIQRSIDKLQAEGLVETDGNRLRLSEKGRDLENYVVSFFI